MKCRSLKYAVTSTLAIALSAFMSFMQAADAFEMTGLVTYNLNQFTARPSNYLSTNNGIGYAFFGRLDLGPGQIESGFMYAPVGMVMSAGPLTATNQGSYWIFPVMYRYVILPPFISIAAGMDYALVGNNDVTISSGSLGPGIAGSGFKSHFGYQVNAEAVQELGENLGAVLDVRYRGGLGNAIYFPNGSAAKYNSWIIALGIQKRLE